MNSGDLQFSNFHFLISKINMAKIKITQVKSGIDRSLRQKRTVRALGISKLHVPVVKEDTPQIQGMIAKVRHLVTVEKI